MNILNIIKCLSIDCINLNNCFYFSKIVVNKINEIGQVSTIISIHCVLIYCVLSAKVLLFLIVLSIAII